MNPDLSMDPCARHTRTSPSDSVCPAHEMMRLIRPEHDADSTHPSLYALACRAMTMRYSYLSRTTAARANPDVPGEGKKWEGDLFEESESKKINSENFQASGTARAKRRRPSVETSPHDDTETSPYLPPEIWALTLQYLEYSDVMQCTAISPYFLHDMLPKVSVLYISNSRSRQLDFRQGRRFRSGSMHTTLISCYCVLLFALYSSLVVASAFTISQSSSRSPNIICTSMRTQVAGGGSLSNADMVRDMLWHMTTYFSSMVDTSRHRFYSLCLPQSGDRIHSHCPIRDLGAAWDATTALLFWSDQQEWLTLTKHSDVDVWKQRLGDAVCSTLQVYNASYSSVEWKQDHQTEAGVALASDILLEPPNIAHSAFVLLASAGALRLSLFQDMSELPPMDGLTRGILSMQREDGAFRIEFGSENFERGIEFYPGEAMVALMDVYELSASMNGILDASTRQAILPAMKRAFDFYADFYHQGNVDTNFNIWQVQAFTRLFDALHDSEDAQSRHEATLLANYVVELCQDIVDSRSWKELARGPSFYPNLETVEIACGLDALAQGIRVASKVSRVMEATRFGRNAENALNFLKAVQDQVPPEVTGGGGLGYGGIQVLEQRLDVTGHAISALTKLYQIYDK